MTAPAWLLPGLALLVALRVSEQGLRRADRGLLMTDPDGWFSELPAHRLDPVELAAALLQAADELQSTVLEVVIKQHELRKLLHVVAQQLTQTERPGEAK